MTRVELHLAVARATGDSIATIKRLGFRLAPTAIDEEEQAPQLVDWDVLQQRRWSDAPRSRTNAVA